jgi:hypothetical protein
LNAISPIDSKFFELIIPIATFLTGTLSGIMLSSKNPDAQMKALEAANAGWNKQPAPAALPTPPSGPRPMSGMPMARPMGMSPMGGFTSPLAEMTTMPIYDDGDPTHRNSRND